MPDSSHLFEGGREEVVEECAWKRAREDKGRIVDVVEKMSFTVVSCVTEVHSI